ncbi:hypothetical protein SMC26_29765 [Actinomadura fulvescens]|uniref:Uncharacterized protein n=1 Tax=Actinomadura fulvescens TaxID=46160 RepID=A0ABP6CZQ4_9ACTN
MDKAVRAADQDWDDDPLTVVTTRRVARRFRLAVRILLGLATVWMVWSVLAYLSDHGTTADPNHHRGMAALIITPVVFLTLLALEVAAPLAKPDPVRIRRRLGLVSAFATVLCLAAIAVAWSQVYERSALMEAKGTVVAGPRQAEDFLRSHLPREDAGAKRIPTGVFLQSVKFEGASDVAVSGYVWQRVPKGAEDKAGVVFPEADDAYVTKDSEVYRQVQGDHTLIGWYFDTQLRQRFDYGSYPLDKQNVWLRMWSADFSDQAILSPDYAAYPPWKNGAMTGVDEQMVYGEWNPDFTAFSYVTNHYNSNFGYGTTATQAGDGTPELYFNLGLKRDPQGPLYGQLIRWLFIALIVFAALFLVTVDSERREVVGFTTFEVMSFAVGMLLVIVFDQVAVREAVEARGVVYLEYFSYALYGMILLVGLNAMLITTKTHIRVLTWGGNLLPKLLYWPCYLGMVLTATLLAFLV